jgi:hypothetical protein
MKHGRIRNSVRTWRENHWTIMTECKECMTDRIETLRMVNELVNWILRSVVFAKREVAPINGICRDLSKCSSECSNVGECCLTSVDVIELPKGDKVREVIEAASKEHVAGIGEQLHSRARVVTVENVMMVNVSHNVGDAVESLIQKEGMSQTSLVFNDEDFAQGTAKYYLVIQRLWRIGQCGIHIIFHVMMVNTEDMSEETLNVGFSKSNAGYR